jgi:hypothetical protein
MYGKAKLFEKLFRQNVGNGSHTLSGAFSALEWGLVRAVEDEDGVDIEREEADEAVVKGAMGGIRSTCQVS